MKNLLKEVIDKQVIVDNDGTEDIKSDVLEILEDLQTESDVEIDPSEKLLIDALQFVISRNEVSETSLTYILEVLHQYVDLEGIELEDEEEEIDFDKLNEAIVTVVRGGKKKKIRKGYRGGKKIKQSTIRKHKLAAKKRHRRKVKSSTIRKIQRSRKKTYRKYKSFLKRK